MYHSGRGVARSTDPRKRVFPPAPAAGCPQATLNSKRQGAFDELVQPHIASTLRARDSASLRSLSPGCPHSGQCYLCLLGARLKCNMMTEGYSYGCFAVGHNCMQTTSKRRAAIPALRNSFPTSFPMQHAAAINDAAASTNTTIWNFLIDRSPVRSAHGQAGRAESGSRPCLPHIC